MANNFKNYFLKNATTAAANVYVGPASTQSTVIGMTIGNTTASPITCNVTVVSSGTTYFMLQNAIISNGGALVPIGGDQKLVMEAGDYMQVQTSTTNSADVIVSVLEIS
jgi:hypothetical protein